MYPHERSLVKRLASRPFALIGINSDDTRAELKKTIRRENMTWRNIFDNGRVEGRIASAWNIQAWPSIFVLDAEGRVRFRGVRGEDLDHAVDQLLAEIEDR